MPAKTYAIGLVACSSRKAKGRMPAKDLYRGLLFRQSFAYMREQCQSVWILSGKYGLVHSDQTISSYDVFLGDKPVAERRAWADMVFQQFCEHIGSPTQRESTILHLLPQMYRQYLLPQLEAIGWELDSPICEGWRLGPMNAWLRQQLSPIKPFFAYEGEKHNK